MKKFLCHLIKNSKSTFKEKYFIYDNAVPGDAPTDAPTDAPDAPAEGTADAEGDAPDAPADTETPQTRLDALQAKVTSLDATIGKVIDNKEYTKGLQAEAAKAKTALASVQTNMQEVEITTVETATLEEFKTKLTAIEGRAEAFQGEKENANKAAKSGIIALKLEAETKEAAMTAEDIKAEILSEENTADLPPELIAALDKNFPLEAVRADLAEKFTGIKDDLERADASVDGEGSQNLFLPISEKLDALSGEKYQGAEVLKDFNTNANRAALWNELKDLGGDGEQCKAAKAKVLENLAKSITENGDFSLDEADNQILAGFVADFVSEKIGQKVTPEQITAKITFHGISTPAKLDASTKAILQALNSPELKGKVNLDWTASTNANPHGVAKTLAEHEEMLSGLDEYEEREAKDTIKVDNTNNPPELDVEGKPINQPGTLDKKLVAEYRKLVHDANLTKGTPQYKEAMKALRDFTKEHKDTLCAAGGHFDMATAIVRARKMRKLVYGEDAGVDTTNEKVVITLTNRSEDVGKGELKSAGLSFSAPYSAPAEEPAAEDEPVAEGEKPPDEEAPPVAGEAPEDEEPYDPARIGAKLIEKAKTKPAAPAAEALPAEEATDPDIKAIDQVKVWIGNDQEAYSYDTNSRPPKDGDLHRIPDKGNDGMFYYSRYEDGQFVPMGLINRVSGTTKLQEKAPIAHVVPKLTNRVIVAADESLDAAQQGDLLANVDRIAEKDWHDLYPMESKAGKRTVEANYKGMPIAGSLQRIYDTSDANPRVVTYYKYDGKNWKELATRKETLESKPDTPPAA